MWEELQAIYLISQKGGFNIPGRIIVAACVGKALSPAVSAFMNMKAEKAGFRFRQTGNFRNHQRSILVGIKLHRSIDAGSSLAADCSRGKGNAIMRIQKITSAYAMLSARE